MDLVELTTMRLAWSPSAALMAWVSLTSPSGVEVPCALRKSTWSAFTPALRKAFTMARRGPSMLGAVMWPASALMP